jgi:hypothetical protein
MIYASAYIVFSIEGSGLHSKATHSFPLHYRPPPLAVLAPAAAKNNPQIIYDAVSTLSAAHAATHVQGDKGIYHIGSLQFGTLVSLNLVVGYIVGIEGIARRKQANLRHDNFTGDLHLMHTPSIGLLGDKYYQL